MSRPLGCAQRREFVDALRARTSLCNKEITNIMLTVTLKRATASTARRDGALVLLHSQEASREGGLSDTHTIDEGRDDPRLQVRHEVAYSMAYGGSRGAALEGDIGGAAATPPIDGAQLSGPRRRDAASSAPEEEAQVAPTANSHGGSGCT